MSVRRSTAATSTSDNGFTLIEVIVAVVLLGVIMPSISVFFVSSIKTSATLQRRDAATQLADEAMDLVRAVPPLTVPGEVSRLLKGRSRAAVEAQWLTAPATLSTTTMAWDPAPAGSPLIPLRVTRTVGQQSYTIDTFIGTCRQRPSDLVCSNAISSGASHYRVVVRVGWSPGPGVTCSGQACEFLLTTVVNSNGEPLFHSAVDAVYPVAVADARTVVAGQPLALTVLSNDTGSFASTPVTILGTGPSNGTLSGAVASGSFTYTAPASFQGTDTFSYRVTDRAGLTSSAAGVTITVTRPAAPTASSPTVCVVRANPSSRSVRLADYVTGTVAGGVFTRLSGPSSTYWQTPSGPAAGDTTGTVSVTSTGRPPQGTYPMAYQFRDAWNRTASGNVTFEVQNSCP